MGSCLTQTNTQNTVDKELDVKRQRELNMANQIGLASKSSIMISPTSPQTISSKESDIIDHDVFESVNVQQNNSKNINNHINQTDILVVRLWLLEVGFPEYYDAFVTNGYDTMDIIIAIESKNDLIEIGITLKGHQTKLLFEIRKLQKRKIETQGEEDVTNVDNMDRDVDEIVVVDHEEMSEEEKNIDNNKYDKMETEYPETCATNMKAYPETVSKGYSDDINAKSDLSDTDSNKYEKEHPMNTYNQTKNGNAYPIHVYTDKGMKNNNTNITKKGKVYPMNTYTNKGNEYENTNETKKGKVYPMNTYTDKGMVNNNNNVTKNEMAYPMGVSKGKEYESTNETTKGKAYPMHMCANQHQNGKHKYTSKGNDNVNAMPITTGR